MNDEEDVVSVFLKSYPDADVGCRWDATGTGIGRGGWSPGVDEAPPSDVACKKTVPG